MTASTTPPPVPTSTPQPFSRPPLMAAARSEASVSRSRADCVRELQRLYAESVARHPDDRNLRLRARVNAIRRKVDIFELYRPYLPEDGVILEWGCKHAPESCLMRFALGDRVRLLGLDFDRGDHYQEWHEYAGLEFTVADHVCRLPYEDESLDVVLSGGVLEHAALPFESLKEIYRVLKVGGVFVVSFLPNKWSYTEFLSRHFGSGGHRRLYSMEMASQLLLHHGLDPQIRRYHQFIPQRGATVSRLLWSMNPFLERCWPFRMFCANLYLVAIKRVAI